ncbi:MAG: putative metal-binding motif-containing protein, partial [Clostridiales bacterium]|nr:putative metal-binding motif-containing protein [Clostridiales bacterium]
LSIAPCIPENAQEKVCDYLDNNCNGDIDEGCDDDGDGYCDAQMRIGLPLESSLESVPYYLEPDFICKKTFEIYPSDAWLYMDCDDENPFAHPRSRELCDGFDNDCNGLKDNLFPEQGKACYLNLTSREIIVVEAPSSNTGSTASASLEGLCGPSTISCENGILVCKDLELTQELCDGIVNTCNTLIDELIPSQPCYGGWGEVDGVLQYIDGLQEGSLWYGTLGIGECWGGDFTCTQSCEMLPEYVFSCQTHVMGGDRLCHDAVTPLTEICDGKNEDCDIEGIDEEYDADNDTYSICGTYARQRESMTPQHELVDCNDADATVNPSMLEIICNGKDDDCNPETLDATDTDGDMHSIDCSPAIPLDCDDNSDDDPEFCADVGVADCTDSLFSACAPCINPAAPEKCGDCRDNNCNGLIDENAVVGVPYDFIIIADISGSMDSENASINEALQYLLVDRCIPPDLFHITTILVGEQYSGQPILAGIRENIREFRENYIARLPSGSSGYEYMLDALAYFYCSFPEERYIT